MPPAAASRLTGKRAASGSTPDMSNLSSQKTPPATILLKKAAGIDKGSGQPNSNKVGKVTRAQLEEIAKLKAPDLNAADLDAAVRIIAGSARSMGLEVEG